MLDKILKEIIVITVGKGAEPIAELLNSKKYVNEFTIAKKLEITINQTRNILYKISDHGLVSSERKKDKKKGWYTYYWKFEIMKCLEFLKNNLLSSKERFNTQITRREEKQFYVCIDCSLEYSEDEALLMEFECDECGELFTTKDNSKLLVGLKKNIGKINERIEEIDIEIAKEQKKLDRKKNIMLKKEELERLAKKEEARLRRAEKKKERDALKAIEEAKNPKKKVVKKKVAKKVAKKATKKKVVKKTTKNVIKKVTKKAINKAIKKVKRKNPLIKKIIKRVSRSVAKKAVKKKSIKKMAKKTKTKKKK